MIGQVSGGRLPGERPSRCWGSSNPETVRHRLDQVDLRFGKLLRFHGTRTLVALDLFNAFNTNTTDVYQTFYGPMYLNPASIMAARLAKISAQFDF